MRFAARCAITLSDKRQLKPPDFVHGHIRNLRYNSVMTERSHCRWCRRPLPERAGRGRPRQFCSQRCRQWHWVSRQRARELSLSEDELVIATSALDEFHDDLYVLACAVDDTESDLVDLMESADPDPAELTSIINWLLDAARPLRARELRPTELSPATAAPPPISS